MSSQAEGIPLRSSAESHGFRLIELPPELEALLTSPDAPPLTLESAGNDTSTILRTPGKSYTLRQKNTSNGILILRPQDDPNSLQQGLTTIATLHETVELDAIKEEVADKPVAKPKGKWHERFGSTR